MPVKAAGNITVTYNAVNITQYLDQHTLDAVVNEIETTNLASTGVESSPSTTKWSIKGGGSWAKALDDVLGPDSITPPTTLRNMVVVIGATGAQATYTWTANAFISNYSIESSAKEVHKWSGTISVNGAPTRT